MNQLQLDVLSQGFKAALISWHNHKENKLHPFIQDKYAEIIHGILNVFPTSEMSLIENSTFWEEWKETIAFHIYSLDHFAKEIGDPYPTNLNDLYINGITWTKDSPSFNRWSLLSSNKGKTEFYFIRYHYKESDMFRKYGSFSFSFLEGDRIEYLPLLSMQALKKIMSIKPSQGHIRNNIQEASREASREALQIPYNTPSSPSLPPASLSPTPTAKASLRPSQEASQEASQKALHETTSNTQADQSISNRFAMLEFD